MSYNQLLDAPHPGINQQRVQDDTNKLIQGIIRHIQQTGCRHCKQLVNDSLEYPKNTQHGTTTGVLNVLESDKSGMDSSIYNNRQDLI